jgi:hypothetical protein
MNLPHWTAAAALALAGVTFAQAPLGTTPGAMPPNHPPMPGATGTAMPPGHPPMGGAAGSAGTLPSNHPSMGDILSANPSPAGMPGSATRPAAVTGSLVVTALPGTSGAPAIVNETVTVELYHRGPPLKKYELPLDKQGKATFPDLPVMPPVQALVSIKHGGLLQQIVTPELNPQDPNQTIQMRVFETTDDMPAWSVAMQHLIVQWSQDGTSARVTEMLSANTPGDRAWLGNKTPDNKRVTLALALPPGADQVELGGSFDEEASSIVDGKLVTASALFPGRSEFRLSYIVPAKDGALELPIAAPAAVGTLVVFLPADDTQVTATGLTGGDPVDMGQGKIRMFRAQGLQTGAIANLSIKGIKAAAIDEHGAPAVATSKFSPRNVAMAGAFLLVLGGLALMLMKKSPSKKGAA